MTRSYNSGNDKRSGPRTDAQLSDQELSDVEGIVDRTLERGIPWLRFPVDLERVFERETSAARTRHLLIGGLLAIVIYDSFLFSDYTMIPDIFRTALVVRFGVITPIAFLIMAALYRGLAPTLRESIEAAVTVVGFTSIVYLIGVSNHPNREYYHTGLILVIVFGNIVVRVRFWHAVAACLATLAIYALFYPSTAGVPAAVAVNNIIVLLATDLFTLFAAYSLEQDQRRSYLLNLRERIRSNALTKRNVRLTALSHIDPLTGLANRLELDEYLGHLLLNRQSNRVAIALFDIDHFKNYNDLYGHPAGDECLRCVAGALSQSLRQNGDMVARFGGEEFVAVLPGSDLQAAEQVAERLRNAVSNLAICHEASPVSKVVTISAGVAAASVSTRDDVQKILSVADTALYRAKSAGRNCVQH